MMAIRKPAGILVTGTSIFIKDPNAAAGSLFAAWQRVPGVGSITLPDEAAAPTDTISLDGSVQSAGFASVGSVAVPLPIAGEHQTHRFLQEQRRNKEAVSVWVRKPARELFNIDAVVAAGGVAVAVNGFSEITILAGKQLAVGTKLREGMLVSIGDAKPAAGAEAFVDYKTAAPAADDEGFQAVLKIPTLDTDDTKAEFIHLAPGYAGENTVAAINLYARQPGKEWKDFECTVGQFADGDFQAAAVVAGNLVLLPTNELAVSTVVSDLAEE